MRINYIFCLMLGLSWPFSNAQPVLPEVKPARTIIDPAMVIQFGGQKIEVLQNIRAIRQESGAYSVVDSDASENIGKNKLGVAYSYTIGSNILFNGEISIKMKSGNTSASLGGTGSGLKLLIPPDIYVKVVDTPQDLVKWVNLLQAQPSVEWVEPFTIRARLN